MLQPPHTVYNYNITPAAINTVFHGANTTKRIQNYVFRLGDVIGRGNFSKVYRGQHEFTNEPVAIKVVQLSSIKTPALVDLLFSEVEILKTLNHPNILKCHQVFTMTELCDGGDLESRIRTKGPMLPEREAYKTIWEIYQGLKYLADQSIVHRDFKIANVLFNNGVAKIADFGFAKRTRQKFKDINIGSPIYMSPEGLIDHIYGPKTDVWAFGVLLFEILHGETPLNFCKSEAELKMHILNPIRFESMNQHLSYDLKELILRCMQIDQRKRISLYQIENLPFMKRIANQRLAEESVFKLSNLQVENRPTCDNSFVHPTPNHHKHTSSNPGFQTHLNINPKANLANILSPRVNNIYNRTDFRNTQQEESRKKNYSFQNSTSNQNRKGISLEKINYQNNLAKPSNNTTSRDKLKPDSNSIPNNNTGQGCMIVSPYLNITFHECVNMLHYCRLIYKSIIHMTKLPAGISLPHDNIQVLTAYLFEVMREIEAKIPNQVKFGGQKAAVREKKLQEVMSEYHKKYYADLKLDPDHRLGREISLRNTQILCLNIIRNLFPLLESHSLNKQGVTLMHYLVCIVEANTCIEKGLGTGDYSCFMKQTNIEGCLSKKTFDENSEESLRKKIQGLLGKGVGLGTHA